jgi:hypothetical protein
MRALIPCMLAVGLMAVPAHAAENEVALEAGLLTTGSETIDAFSTDGVIPAFGLRGGWAFADRAALMLSVHHSREGGTGITGSGQGSAVLASAYDTTQVSLGVKGDWTIEDLLELYATGSVIGFRGLMRFDDDPGTRNNPGQLRAASLSLGGSAVIGAAIMTQKGKVRPALHLEMGWAGILPHRYQVTPPSGGDAASLGRVGLSSFVLRGGAGIRF